VVIRTEVRARFSSGEDVIKRKSRLMMVLSAAKLHELGLRDAYFDGDQHWGGVPVDRGRLKASWTIIDTGDFHCVVGTNLGYAGALARGDADPDVRLIDIEQWADRKRIDIDPEKVWEDIMFNGPIPNPFHQRAADDFIDEFPGILEMVRNG